jgi:ribosomal protein S18 acetylase RimI-like enzyme
MKSGNSSQADHGDVINVNGNLPHDGDGIECSKTSSMEISTAAKNGLSNGEIGKIHPQKEAPLLSSATNSVASSSSLNRTPDLKNKPHSRIVDEEEYDESQQEMRKLFPLARSPHTTNNVVSGEEEDEEIEEEEDLVEFQNGDNSSTGTKDTTSKDVPATIDTSENDSRPMKKLRESKPEDEKKLRGRPKRGVKRESKDKILASKRKLKLDAEALREQQQLIEKRNWAQGILQRALFDDGGEDREFPSETIVHKTLSQIRLEILPASRLQNELLEDLLTLTRNNMKDLYDGSGSPAWAWNDARKRGELRNDRMRWIIVRKVSGEGDSDENFGIETPESNEKNIIGFVAFRFTAELGIPHTYLHELQLWNKVQKQGLGQILMEKVQQISRQTLMQLIMLTVFAQNVTAIKFYEKLGFAVDEASPGPCYNLMTDECRSPYEIMSKLLDPAVLAYGCGECSYRCRFQDTLQQHDGFVHHKPWPYPCTYPGCGGGTVHFHQLQKHNELKHACLREVVGNAVESKNNEQSHVVSDATASDLQSTAPNFINTRVTFKSDGKRGTVVKLGDKGFYTVRLDGPKLETVVCRATSFIGYIPPLNRPKKKTYDPDHELALKLQYEDGWARKSSRFSKLG